LAAAGVEELGQALVLGELQQAGFAEVEVVV
jgi:hypothetical protein